MEDTGTRCVRGGRVTCTLWSGVISYVFLVYMPSLAHSASVHFALYSFIGLTIKHFARENEVDYYIL